MVEVFSNGTMETSLMVSFMKIISMEKERTPGKTAANTMATGTKTKCMVMEFSRGQTDENTRDSMSMTTSKAMACSSGQTGAPIQDLGSSAKWMERARTPRRKVVSASAFGKKARDSNGSRRTPAPTMAKTLQDLTIQSTEATMETLIE